MQRALPVVSTLVGVVLGVALAVVVDGSAQPAQPAPFHGDVERLADEHHDFRRVLYTGRVQLVMMTLRPDESIGAETHPVDQCFFVIDGEGEATVGGQRWRLDDDEVVCVPAGTRHDVRNTERNDDLQIATVYGPPQHPAGTVHATRADAVRAEAREQRGA